MDFEKFAEIWENARISGDDREPHLAWVVYTAVQALINAGPPAPSKKQPKQAASAPDFQDGDRG